MISKCPQGQGGMDLEFLLNEDVSRVGALNYMAFRELSKERQGVLLARIKKQFCRRYLNLHCGVRMAMRFIPVGVEMLQKTNLSDAVFFWQQCIERGLMAGTLEEKLVNPAIGFTVEECKMIGLREEVANGWLCFYENDMM